MEFKNINITRTNILDIDCIARQLRDHKHRLADITDFPIPSGNNNKILAVVNNVPAWIINPGLPSFTGNAGKYLTTDGTQAIWQFIPVQQQSDWNEADNLALSFIKNKPYIPQNISDLVNDSGYVLSTLTLTINGITYDLSFNRTWNLTTTDIPEGTNLYYSNSRVRAALSLTTSGNNGAATYNSGTGVFNIPTYTLAGLGGVPLIRTININGITYDLDANRTWTLTTSDITEGSNLYYTDARVRAAISFISGTANYNSTTGVISIPTTTSHISEGSNLYYTDARVLSYGNTQWVQLDGAYSNPIWITDLAWSKLTGTPNSLLGYGILDAYTKGEVDTLLTGYLLIANFNSTFDARLALKTTSDLAEGSNLYFTTSRARNSLSFSAGSGAFNSITGVITIPTDNNQIANSAGYITTINGITAGGELSGTYPNPTLINSAVVGKVLTGLNITGGSIVDTDSILIAFGKTQNQINGLMGGATYQNVWNASTNSPTITSSVGTKGHYYVVNVAGSTNINGITDWKVGDWIIFNGATWDKVDNTDAVSSVNGFVGAVSLTTANIPEVTNLYYLDSRARAAISSSATGLSYNNSTGVFTLTSGYVIPTTTQETNWNLAYAQTRQWDGGATGLNTATGRASLGLGSMALEATSSYYTTTQIQNFFGGSAAMTGYNKSNWDTAFGWGNHASAGYITAAAQYYIGTTLNALNRASAAQTLTGISIDGQALLLGATSSSLTAQRGNGTVSYDYAILNPQTGLFPAADNSNSILTLNRHSGDYYSQLGFSSNSKLYYRRFSNTPINTSLAWQEILTSMNYNDFSPTLFGVGASGTWNINVTGNANNITQYTINQNLGISNSPTFTAVTAANFYGVATGATTLVHNASRTDSSWYNIVWASGSPSPMYSADSVMIRSSDGAIRANIFYDNADTGYYVDPNSVSNLNVIYGLDVRARKAQTDGAYTSAALWVESFSATTTGIAFHISGVVGKFLEMRTNGTLYWHGSTILDSSNYNNYSPTLTGGNASGTWAINITGNAQFLANNYLAATNPNGLFRAGAYTFFNAPNTPGGDFGLLVFPTWSSTDASNRYMVQLGANIGGNLLFRSTDISGGGSWATILSSTNYASYSLPLAGGTMNQAANIRMVGNDPTNGYISFQNVNGGSREFRMSAGRFLASHDGWSIYDLTANAVRLHITNAGGIEIPGNVSTGATMYANTFTVTASSGTTGINFTTAGNADVWMSGGGTFRIINGAYTYNNFYVTDAGNTYIRGITTLGAALNGTSLSMSGGGSFLGNVGVGTASPAAKLDVVSAADANAYALAGFQFLRWTSGDDLVFGGVTASQWRHLRLFTNGTEKAQLASDGTFLINTTTTDGVNKLIVNGGVKANGAISSNNTSGSAGQVLIFGSQAGAKNYEITNVVAGISNTGFTIRNATDARNELSFDGSGAATFSSSVTANGQILANNVASNIRLKGDGGTGNDGLVYMTVGGVLGFTNVSGTRGFTISNINTLAHTGAITAYSSVTATGAGGRTVKLIGGGNGVIRIAGDGSSYATGIEFRNTEDGTINTAIHNYAAGGVHQWLSIGGTAYNNAPMYVTTTSVGIGTQTPTENLTVFGNSARFAVTGTSGAAAIMIGNRDSAGTNTPAMIQAANGNMAFGRGNSWSGGGTFSATFNVNGDGKAFVTSDYGSYGQFQINAPTVSTEASISFATGGSGLNLGGYVNTGVVGLGAYGNSKDTLVLSTGLSSGTLFLKNGNVGIGEASPTSKLHLTQSIVPRITLVKSGILTWFIGNPSQGASNNFAIGTDSGGLTEILTINNVGNATLIGNLSVQSGITVTGNRSVFSWPSTGSSYSLATAEIYSSGTYGPRLSLHWGGVVASQIEVQASGRIAFTNNPGTGYENVIAGDFYASTSFTGNIYRSTGTHQSIVLNASTGAISLGYATSGTTLDLTGRISISSNRLYLGADATYGTGVEYFTVGFGGNGNGSNRIFAHTDVSDGIYLAAATGRGIKFRVNGSGVDSVIVNSTGTVDFTNAISAPIIYDYNDTGYYLDMNSTSRLQQVSTHLAPSPLIPRAGNWANDFNATPVAAMSYGGDLSSGGPQGTWWFQQNFRHSNASNYWGTQIAWGWEDNANELWQRNVTGGSWGSWVRYLNTNNSPYAINMNQNVRTSDNVTFANVTAQQFNGRLASGEITDLNSGWAGSTLNNGIAIWRYNTSASNWPSSPDNANWVMNIFSHQGGYGSQFAASNNINNLHYRSISNGSFSGWVTILHSSNAGFAWAMNQHVRTTDNVTFNQVTATNGGFNSDLTLKNVIGEGSLINIADQNKIIRFTWKDQAKGTTMRYGYGAQYIQALIPEAVYKTTDGTLAVDYTQVHTVLIDENTRRIQALEARVKELESQLNRA